MKDYSIKSENIISIKENLEKLGTYTISQVNDLPEVNGTGFVLCHNKTKARISVVVNDDENKVFAIGFRTPPTNSKGIQHIVEHTVLCGSKKYPAKDPFVELAKGSLNTFLNAMTYGDKTVYPIASCNDKDFRNLMDVYLDAVFNPNIYSREEIFKQEGWHYELEDKAGDIKINGVVYNEMRGVYSSPDSVLANEMNQMLYPDTVYSVDSGGDPDVIPELTREEYLDYHRNYYHPSNSYIYLYGDLDPAEQLDYIDKEYLSGYDYLYVPSEIPLQKPFDKPIYHTVEYSVAEGDDTENAAMLTYNVVLGESRDKMLTEAMNILQFILIDSPGAPLKKKIIDSGICSDVESQYDSSMRQPMFTILARDANENDEDRFVQIIEAELKNYVENGLDKKALEAALNNFEFKAKESDFFRIPKGLSFGLASFETWLYDDEKVHDKFSVQDVYDYLRKGIYENLLNPDNPKVGVFEEIIDRYLINNNHKAYVKAVPREGLNQKKDIELAKRLAQYKAGLSDEELESLIADTKHLKAYQEEPSTPEELATIPLLSIEDINPDIRQLYNREEVVAGTKLIKHDIFTNGISYLDIFFKINDVRYEDISKVQLLVELLKYVDTDEHTYNDLSKEINLRTGGVSFAVGYFDSDKAPFLYVNCKTKTFDDRISDGIDLIREIITESHITDRKRIKEVVSEIKAVSKNVFVESGHITAKNRAGSYIFLSSKLMEATDGIDYYRFIDNIDKNFDSIYEELAAELKMLYNKIFRKASMLISYTSMLDSSVLEEPLLRLTDSISDEEYTDKKFELALDVKNEAFKTASKVQYVATAGDFKSKGLEYTGALNVLQIIFSYDYLWINVRVKGGAYGAMCDFTRKGYSYMTSYRDPNIRETYEIFKKAAEYVENFDCSDRDMTKYIIGAFAKTDAPISPSLLGVLSFTAYITGVTDEERIRNRREMLNCTQETIRELAPYVHAVSDSEVICVVGGEDKINEVAGDFKEVTKLI